MLLSILLFGNTFFYRFRMLSHFGSPDIFFCILVVGFSVTFVVHFNRFFLCNHFFVLSVL